MNIESPPYRWFDRCTGQLTGSLPHLIDRIFKNLSIDYQYSPLSAYRPEVIVKYNLMMLNGELDARSTNDVNKLDGILYSESAISSVIMSAFYLSDAVSISNLEDLRRLKAGVITPSMKVTKFSIGQRYLKANQIPFILVPSEAAGVEALKLGKIDYLMSRKYSPLLLIKGNFKSFDIEEPITSFYFSVSENSRLAERMPEINREIKKAHESGLMDFLDKNYLLLWFAEREMKCPKNLKKTTQKLKLSEP
ncbi:hypothetical protein [Oceanicoccus sp. KOV_DT_Chl]|uniref:hypothetical protein n=1 Tax=Oceanicoccus sp. KOV_DT_Chl TaxID=1904639 RepID=UPI0011AF94E1|nr:hypothetical protein [Oceanicoccus sp. KOV_DT_Chl]